MDADFEMPPHTGKRGRPRKYPKVGTSSPFSPGVNITPDGGGASDSTPGDVDVASGSKSSSGIKRGRGRPRKYHANGLPSSQKKQQQQQRKSLLSPSSSPASGKRGRGRPPKLIAVTKPRPPLELAISLTPSPPPPTAPPGRSHLRRHSSALSPHGGTDMPSSAACEAVRAAPFMDAVVKVFCVHTEPNFSLPWQRKRQFSSNSSGFIIGGRRVLTNAHSVEHHTQVKVKRRGSDTKFLASVLAIGTECDIALLAVSDDAFWEGVTPVEFGALPSLQDAVTVVGYPIGGDTISVTSGVVSRIEVTSYVHSATELLGVQIDAAINSGNSGGPAFNDKGECVGIAFQSLKHEDVENIGYVIPTPVITHFINDYERNGDYTAFPILGIEWQKMENPDLRKALGMTAEQKGVRVRRVEPTAPAAQYLKSSDILLSFDNVNIANDGTVPFRHGERISFSYLVSQKYTGEKARLRILRDEKILEFDVELLTHKRLVPAHIKGKPPSYYIVAGLVFVAISVPYLRSEYGKDYDFDAPVKLLEKLLHVMAKTEDEQLVVISQVLVSDTNIGYEDIMNTQVVAFNGVKVRNLKHLASMVERCKEEFLKFELEYQQMVVLLSEKAKAATQDILATHCIPSAMSEDLKK